MVTSCIIGITAVNDQKRVWLLSFTFDIFLHADSFEGRIEDCYLWENFLVLAGFFDMSRKQACLIFNIFLVELCPLHDLIVTNGSGCGVELVGEQMFLQVSKNQQENFR